MPYLVPIPAFARQVCFGCHEVRGGYRDEGGGAGGWPKRGSWIGDRVTGRGRARRTGSHGGGGG